MAFESEDIRQRQQRRQQDRIKRQQQQQRQKRRLMLVLIIAAVVLALCSLLILLLQGFQNSHEPPATQATQPIQTEPTQPQTVINIAFGGDLNITDRVVASGSNGGAYDYTNLFLDVVPVLAGADASVINFEGNLYGAPYGSQHTSAPPELMNALADAGVDLIQMANSCAINNGLTGLQQTLSGIQQAGMEGVGAFSNNDAFEQSRGFTLRDINGVKVAFVAFTKGMDGLGLPQGSENCVNLLYTDYTSSYSEINTDGITNILRSIELEKPDVTVALLHWGSAYNSIISNSQKKIVKLLQENGVDAIVGTHSHYLQNVEFDAASGSLVAYSLGDFLGDANKSNTNFSTILQLEITKDNTTGKTVISGYDHTPIYIATPERDGVPQLKLLRIEQAMAAYEANNIHKISDETYAAMKTALSRINSRVELET